MRIYTAAEFCLSLTLQGHVFFFKKDVHDFCWLNPSLVNYTRILLEFSCSTAPVRMHLMHKGPGDLGVFSLNLFGPRSSASEDSPVHLAAFYGRAGVSESQMPVDMFFFFFFRRFWCRLDVMFQLRVPFSDSWQRLLPR